MPITQNDGQPVINERGNTGKSILIKPDPLSVTTPISLGLFPVPEGSPIREATLLEVSGDDIKSEVVSLTLDNPNPFAAPTAALTPAPGSNVLARPFAKVQWGVGGIQSEAEVDFDHGLSLSIPCSYLRVNGVNDRIPARCYDISGTGVVSFGRNIRLGAFCGFGSVAGTKNLAAKRTIYIDAPGLLSGNIKIPPFATNFTIQRNPSTTPMIATLLDEGGVAPIEQLTYPAGSGFEGAVELSGDAAFIFLAFPAGTTACRIIFGLSF